jgi:elongation factor Tu
MSTLTAAIVARQAHKNHLKTVRTVSASLDYETPRRHYHHVDCPGGWMVCKDRINALARMDGAILVVAADEGPMPRTCEHLVLARLSDVPSLVVFLNKVDRVDDFELLERTEFRLRELLSKYEFPADEVPIIRGDALAAMRSQGADDLACWCIDNLVDALDTCVTARQYELDAPFLMRIEDIFAIQGRGIVSAGPIERGKVKAGDEVEIVGLRRGSRKTVVTGVLKVNQTLEIGVAGDNVGVLLQGVERDEVKRGQVIATPGSITPYTKFEANVSVLTAEEGGRTTPFFSGYRPQFYSGTTDVTGTIELPEGVEMCLPGDHVKIRVELLPDSSMALEEGQRFVVGEGGWTVGSGMVTKILS